VRDYKEGVDSYHGLKARVMTCNSGEDDPQLLVGLLETPRCVPIDGKERVGSVALTNVKVTYLEGQRRRGMLDRKHEGKQWVTSSCQRWEECRERAPEGLGGMRRGFGKMYRVRSNE